MTTTFRVTVKESNYYITEIEANDFADAKDKAQNAIWHSRYQNWGIAYDDVSVDEVIETND
jgi:hypothetical protein